MVMIKPFLYAKSKEDRKKMDELEGQILTSKSGTKYYLSKIIGQGAQGIIYSTADDEYVVKLYKNESELKNKKKLKKLTWLLKTNYPDQFIKPLDIIDSPYIGYVMKKVKGHISLNKLLIPNREMSFSEWYNTNSGGLYRRLLVGQKIATQFANLHKMNLAYCDLSGNNILVNENTDVNSVCMIDIDNIYIPGADEVNVLGTSRYMAPEILTRQLDPDIFTDSYSLAVILFELLKAGHPYIGDFIEDGTPEQMTEAYKGFYPYVEDPSNDLNRSSQMLPSDVVFTTQLKELFQKTFIDGKENRVSRIRAQEYALAFQRASNLVVKCSNCGNWHYARPDENHKYICPWCDAPYEKPVNLIFKERYVCKLNGKKIEIKDKPIECYVLKEKSTNIITKNYINTAYNENDTESLDEYFKIRLLKNGPFCLINELGYTIAIQKARENTFKILKKGEYSTLDKNDTIIFMNPNTWKNYEKEPKYEFGNNAKGVSFRFAVVN